MVDTFHSWPNSLLLTRTIFLTYRDCHQLCCFFPLFRAYKASSLLIDMILTIWKLQLPESDKRRSIHDPAFELKSNLEPLKLPLYFTEVSSRYIKLRFDNHLDLSNNVSSRHYLPCTYSEMQINDRSRSARP
jgi:hypothetical protein